MEYDAPSNKHLMLLFTIPIDYSTLTIHLHLKIVVCILHHPDCFDVSLRLNQTKVTEKHKQQTMDRFDNKKRKIIGKSSVAR